MLMQEAALCLALVAPLRERSAQCPYDADHGRHGDAACARSVRDGGGRPAVNSRYLSTLGERMGATDGRAGETSTSWRASSSISARPSNCRTSCSRSCSCRPVKRPKPATRPGPTCWKPSRPKHEIARKIIDVARNRKIEIDLCRRSGPPHQPRHRAHPYLAEPDRHHDAAASAPPTRTCKTSLCAARSGARSGTPLSRRQAKICCLATIRRSSCACSPMSPKTRR